MHIPFINIQRSLIIWAEQHRACGFVFSPNLCKQQKYLWTSILIRAVATYFITTENFSKGRINHLLKGNIAVILKYTFLLQPGLHLLINVRTMPPYLTNLVSYTIKVVNRSNNQSLHIIMLHSVPCAHYARIQIFYLNNCIMQSAFKLQFELLFREIKQDRSCASSWMFS